MGTVSFTFHFLKNQIDMDISLHVCFSCFAALRLCTTKSIKRMLRQHWR
jgi:hypothetical protein